MVVLVLMVLVRVFVFEVRGCGVFGQSPNASKGQLSAAAKNILAKAHHIKPTQQALDMPARLADYDMIRSPGFTKAPSRTPNPFLPAPQNPKGFVVGFESNLGSFLIGFKSNPESALSPYPFNLVKS